MRKDYRFRKNYYFCLSFLSKSRTYWQNNLNEKSLLKQIFRVVEMSFRNHFLLCVATVAMSCRNNSLMQNLIPANINLISGQLKPFSPIFFQTLLPQKVTFTSNANILLNQSFIPASGNLFSVQWKKYAFFRSLFSAVGNHD